MYRQKRDSHELPVHHPTHSTGLKSLFKWKKFQYFQKTIQELKFDIIQISKKQYEKINKNLLNK
jgi:hypothetical protein